MQQSLLTALMNSHLSKKGANYSFTSDYDYLGLQATTLVMETNTYLQEHLE